MVGSYKINVAKSGVPSSSTCVVTKMKNIKNPFEKRMVSVEGDGESTDVIGLCKREMNGTQFQPIRVNHKSRRTRENNDEAHNKSGSKVVPIEVPLVFTCWAYTEPHC